MDWHDPEFAGLHAFLRWLITERGNGTALEIKGHGDETVTTTITSELLKFGAKLGGIAPRH